MTLYVTDYHNNERTASMTTTKTTKKGHGTTLRPKWEQLVAQSCYWLLLAQCKISLKLSVLAFVETYSKPQNYKVLHNPSLNKYVGDWYNYINLENLDE